MATEPPESPSRRLGAVLPQSSSVTGTARSPILPQERTHRHERASPLDGSETGSSALSRDAARARADRPNRRPTDYPPAPSGEPSAPVAASRVREGEAPSAVIASYGFRRTTIYKWLTAAAKPGVGLRVLQTRPAPGRPRSLTPRQEQQVFFWDESGFRADTVHGRTWGVRGQTPVVPRPGQRQSVGAASVTNAKGGAWYCTYQGVLTAEPFVRLLRQMLRHRVKPIHLMVDGVLGRPIILQGADCLLYYQCFVILRLRPNNLRAKPAAEVV